MARVSRPIGYRLRGALLGLPDTLYRERMDWAQRSRVRCHSVISEERAGDDPC